MGHRLRGVQALLRDIEGNDSYYEEDQHPSADSRPFSNPYGHDNHGRRSLRSAPEAHGLWPSTYQPEFVDQARPYGYQSSTSHGLDDYGA